MREPWWPSHQTNINPMPSNGHKCAFLHVVKDDAVWPPWDLSIDTHWSQWPSSFAESWVHCLGSWLWVAPVDLVDDGYVVGLLIHVKHILIYWRWWCVEVCFIVVGQSWSGLATTPGWATLSRAQFGPFQWMSPYTFVFSKMCFYSLFWYVCVICYDFSQILIYFDEDIISSDAPTDPSTSMQGQMTRAQMDN